MSAKYSGKRGCETPTTGLKRRHICELLCISGQVFWRFSKKFLITLVDRFNSITSYKIGKPGIIVEIDESKFGKRKYHRSHSVEGVWVLGIVERTPLCRIVLVSVVNRKAETLIELIKRYVHKDSIIYTDGWRGYSLVKNHFTDHLSVNHSISFKDSISGVHTNTIEGNWSGIKNQEPIRSRTVSLVTTYLIRFMVKRNYPQTALNEFIKLFF